MSQKTLVDFEPGGQVLQVFFQGGASISFTGKTLCLQMPELVLPLLLVALHLSLQGGVNALFTGRAAHDDPSLLSLWQLDLTSRPAELPIRRFLPLSLCLERFLQFLACRTRGFWHATDPAQPGCVQPCYLAWL